MAKLFQFYAADDFRDYCRRGGDTAPRLRYPDAPMASLALERDTRAQPEPPSRGSGELIDFRSVAADLEKIAQTHSGNERDMRAAVAQRLKAALSEGRAKAEQLLLKDRHGRACAEQSERSLQR